MLSNALGAPLCSGLARRPLKAVARVRIPSGLQGVNALVRQHVWLGRFAIPAELLGGRLTGPNRFRPRPVWRV